MAIGPPGYQWAQEGAGVTSGEIEVLRKQVDSLRVELESVRMQTNTVERWYKESGSEKKQEEDKTWGQVWMVWAGLAIATSIALPAGIIASTA